MKHALMIAAFAACPLFAAPASACERHAATPTTTMNAGPDLPVTLVADTGKMDHSAMGHGAMKMDGQAAMPMVMVEPVKAGDLEITGYWARAMLPNQPVAGGFVTVTNTGAEDDRIIAASSPRAGRMELHEMVMDGDVMKMREKDGGISVPAGETVELKPGGLHIMFMEVGDRFEEGQTVPVTLTFEKAGDVTFDMPVKKMPMKM